MITAVAVVPTTPLVLPAMPGRAHEGIAAITAAAVRATAELAGVDLVIALAGGGALTVAAPPTTDLVAYGLHLPEHALDVPPPGVAEALLVAVGAGGVPGFEAPPPLVTRAPSVAPGVGLDLAVLARWAPAGVPCVGVTLPSDTPAAVAEAVAAAVRALAADRRVGLLVAGDLGAGHGPKPPRPAAAAASAALQDLVIAALDNGRPADLVRLAPHLAADSAARAIGALRVLGHLLDLARLGTVVRTADAPLGVGYVVAQGG